MNSTDLLLHTLHTKLTKRQLVSVILELSELTGGYIDLQQLADHRIKFDKEHKDNY